MHAVPAEADSRLRGDPCMKFILDLIDFPILGRNHGIIILTDHNPEQFPALQARITLNNARLTAFKQIECYKMVPFFKNPCIPS
jgi:hypothetical protein